MGKKVVTSIKIDEDILKEAKKLGLVISKIAENAVKRYVYVLKKSGAYDFIEEEGHIIAISGDRTKAEVISPEELEGSESLV